MQARARRWCSSPVIAIAVFAAAGCTLESPLRGPGLQGRTSTLAPTAGPRVVVALTHAVLDNAQRHPFNAQVRQVLRGIEGQPGLLAYSVRMRPFGNEVWTMTVWEDDAARTRFVGSDLHRSAMTAGLPAVRSARFRHVEVAAADIPLGWDRALHLLDEDSRTYSAR